MCGGFALHDYVRDDLVDLFADLDYEPTYNIRPTMQSPVVRMKDGQRIGEVMQFGMVPVWAKDIKISYKMFNARSETLFEKPAWKRPAKSKRCLIPANGFFEWEKREEGKYPFYITDKKTTPMLFAGVYDHWTDKSTGEVLMSYAIITTTPNKEMKTLHDRMPVILDASEEDGWLSEDDEGFLKSILNPLKDNSLHLAEVSQAVNTARGQGSEMIEPI